MRAGAETEVRLAPPIFQIVARTEARQAPVGDFVVLVSGVCEACTGGLVGFRHSVVTGNGFRAVAAAARERFLSQAAAFVNFEQVNGNVLRANF